ncbi:GDSL-type esterase/lipase family protein [Ruminococcus sp. HUN007]|uniref:GDSL-type esterase/lipase family protein n=1 Tax=Ruminococcus sp. HUN007 TaxID=1514668 RepID=UPI0005D27A29|nr:GDSL-type esterase/lipase family protein [Ruminococcus sp. HUN007]
MKGSDYYDTCAFVGDSHTNGLWAYGFVDSSRVFAKDGLSISNIQQSISPSSIASVSPENIYIMMGTNGVAWLKSSDMISSYEDFVGQIVSQIPGVNIYILSIPPVSYERSTTTDAKKNISMDRIREYNSDLQDMAARHEWYFLDTFSAICGSSGYLEGSTDGVHMNKDLYVKFTDYILSHTVE